MPWTPITASAMNAITQLTELGTCSDGTIAIEPPTRRPNSTVETGGRRDLNR
jgi:hypothetical protein